MLPDLTEIEIVGDRGSVPFFIRAGYKADEGVVQEIFGDRIYGLSPLKRSADIGTCYADIVNRGKRALIIDAGANIGASALYFSFCFTRSHIVALEPDNGNFKMMEHNLAPQLVRDSADRAEFLLLRKSLGGMPGWDEVLPPPKERGSAGIRTRHSPQLYVGSCVERVTIPQLYLATRAHATPFIVKIAIEGGERDVFSELAVRTWIDETPIIIVQLTDDLYPKSGAAQMVIDAFSQSKYRDFIIQGNCLISIDNRIPVKSAIQAPEDKGGLAKKGI